MNVEELLSKDVLKERNLSPQLVDMITAVFQAREIALSIPLDQFNEQDIEGHGFVIPF